MGFKILAIDDSHTLRVFIKNTLSETFPEEDILLARDGREGVALAKEHLPSVILLDFLMPELRGDQVCEALLADANTARIPVILMSSSAAEIKATEAKCSNVVRAIAKPFTPELLCSTVSHVTRAQAPQEFPATEPGSPAQPTSQINTIPEPFSRTSSTSSIESSSTAEDVAGPLPQTPSFTASDSSSQENAGFHTALLGRKSADSVILRGKTSHQPLRGVLNAIEDEKLTGSLRLQLRDQLIITYFSKGRPLLTTTPNTKLYLRGGQPSLPPECKQWLEDARKQQSETGCPLFISLAQSGSLTKAAALQFCYQYTRRTFARAWITNRVQFEFHRMQQVPTFATFVDPYPGNVDEWAMETLRTVGDEALSAIAWGEPNGIPTYTRAGYERIQQIALLEEEMTFASLVSNNLPLQEIATHLQISVEKAQQILFRFLCLDIFAYWPASVLRGNTQLAA